MSWESIISLSIAAVSLVTAPFLYIWRTTVQRVDNIEHELKTKISKEDLKEKLEPISDDLKEVKGLLDKVLNRLINDSK